MEELEVEPVIKGMTQVPPKLSEPQRLLAHPESQVEDRIREMTGVEVPPGPQGLILSAMESAEATMPAAPAFPGGIPGSPGGSPGESSKEPTSPGKGRITEEPSSINF